MSENNSNKDPVLKTAMTYICGGEWAKIYTKFLLINFG